jgi:predicted ATP-dependent serine protease
MGANLSDIEATIQAGADQVVIVDTIRLFRIGDENDNSAINTALTPLITLCRVKHQTLLLAHHTRKGGGEYGEAAAGGHALVGIVDVVIELIRDKQSSRRRVIRGWGRVVEVVESVYEMDDDGSLRLLGNPRDLEFQEIVARVQETLTVELQPTKTIWESLEEPRPSQESVRQALNFLAQRGTVQRDPPFSEGPNPGKRYWWRASLNLTSNVYIPIVGGEVSLEEGTI